MDTAAAGGGLLGAAIERGDGVPRRGRSAEGESNFSGHRGLCWVDAGLGTGDGASRRDFFSDCSGGKLTVCLRG